MNIEFTTLAENDLEKVLRHIAQFNVDAAYRVRDAILDTCDLLLEQPQLAEEVPSRLEGLRRAVVKDYPAYLIFYFHHEDDDRIEIIRLGEGHQDWLSILA